MASSVRQFLRTYGGLFRASSLSDNKHASNLLVDIATAVNIAETEARQISNTYTVVGAKGARIKCVITDSYQFSARCRAFKTVDVVAIDVGLCKVLWYSTARFASVMHNLVHVPLELLEENDESSYGLTSSSDEAILSLFPEKTECFRALHSRLFCFAFLWIFHHEMAHLWNGHSEAFEDIKGALDHESLMQARFMLEIDADSRSVSGATNFLKNNLISDELEFLPPADRRQAFVQYLDMLIIGMLIGQHTQIIREVVNESLPKYYPSSVERSINLTNGVERELARSLGFEAREAETLVSRSKHIFETILKATFGRDVMIIKESDLLYQPLSIQDRGRAWNAILPILSKYMRGLSLPGVYGVAGQERIFGTADPRVDESGRDILGNEAFRTFLNTGKTFKGSDE